MTWLHFAPDRPLTLSFSFPLHKDAVRHVARIHRVLGLKRGNLMLVGVGGSGRQSLTRLVAYISGQELFMIEITKNYRQVPASVPYIQCGRTVCRSVVVSNYARATG